MEEYKDLCAAFSRCAVIMKRRYMSRENREMMFLWMINHLAEIHGERIRVTDISERFHMPIAAASKALSRSEENGYIVRAQDSEDRRVTYITLSDEGKKALGEMEQKGEADYIRMAAKFGTEKAGELARLLSEFCDLIEEENR